MSFTKPLMSIHEAAREVQRNLEGESWVSKVRVSLKHGYEVIQLIVSGGVRGNKHTRRFMSNYPDGYGGYPILMFREDQDESFAQLLPRAYKPITPCGYCGDPAADNMFHNKKPCCGDCYNEKVNGIVPPIDGKGAKRVKWDNTWKDEAGPSTENGIKALEGD